MESIICDTNIWYNIANKKNDEFQLRGVELIGTSINIIEISSTPNILNNIDLVVEAIRSMHKHCYELIIHNPIEHIITLFHDNYIPNCTVEKKLLAGFNILMSIDIHSISVESFMQAEKQINNSIAQNNDLIERINSGLPFIKEKIKNLGKSNYRRNVFLDEWKKFFSELISEYSKKYCDMEYTLDLNSNKWDQLEFFLYTWEYYFKNNIEFGNWKLNNNDWNDLLNLVYVQPGFKYWTLEKKWNRIYMESDKLRLYMHS